MPNPWSRTEVELIVADYFAMLFDELAGKHVDKTARRKALQPHLAGRSEGSIEFKHQNLSAVLINFDQPYIDGYKPRQNYQDLLEQVVLEFIEADRQLSETVTHSPVLNPTAPPVMSWDDVLGLMEAPPDRDNSRDKSKTGKERRTRAPVQIDFVQRDARNRVLGKNGEEWATEFERRRLHDVDKRPDLAKRVDWVAQTRGDGLGYDIESFNQDGSPRLIEVKTTGLGKHFPFYVTANELRVSQERAPDYHLYRVFNFATSPRLYPLQGALDAACHLEPQSFVARVG